MYKEVIVLTFDSNTEANIQLRTIAIPQYSQTCLKGSSKGRIKIGCLRQVIP